MNSVSVIKDKVADLRNLVEKSLIDINPETSTIKAIQQSVIQQAGNGRVINIQIQNVYAQQISFNLTMCLAHIVEVENQLNELQKAKENKFEVPTTQNAFEQLKRKMMITALENNNWLQKAAAKDLGMSPRAFHYALNKYKINDPQGRWRLER